MPLRRKLIHGIIVAAGEDLLNPSLALTTTPWFFYHRFFSCCPRSTHLVLQLDLFFNTMQTFKSVGWLWYMKILFAVSSRASSVGAMDIRGFATLHTRRLQRSGFVPCIEPLLLDCVQFSVFMNLLFATALEKIRTATPDDY